MGELQLISLIGLLLFQGSVWASSPCDGWEPFNDEHCYVIVHQLVPFEQASKSCQQIGGSLLKIEKPEEQTFLVDFLFNRSKIVDAVWLGGRLMNNQKRFLWSDQSEVKWTDWATGNPKNLANGCIEMKAEVGLVGKWADEPCDKSNLIVCQRRPSLSLGRMEEILLKLEQELVENKKQLLETKQKLEDKLTKTQQELSAIKANPVPIGFTYVQLPKDRSPREIWPGLTWTDVSPNYTGLFFRVEGGSAATFGQIQEENGPFFEQIHTGLASELPAGETEIYPWKERCTLPKSGWSKGIHMGGGDTGTNDIVYLSLKRPDISEVRPKNMAMRVWRRTA